MAELLASILGPFSLVSLLVFIFVTKFFFFRRNKQSNYLPPSPSKLPIIGNLHQLGIHPHRSLASLASLHGPLMLLHLGAAPTLVVSSAEAAKEFLRTHDLIFSNRSNSSIAKKLLYDQKDLAQVNYGEYWRQMRSICVFRLLSTKRVQLFRSIREEEAALFVKQVEESSLRSSAVDLSQMFVWLTNNVICRVCFGRKYGEEGDGGRKFKKLLQDFGTLLGVFDIGDFIPWLAWINCINGLNSRVEKVFREFDCFLDNIVDDHMARFDQNTAGSTKLEDEMNFVEVLLNIQKMNTQSLGRDNIKAIILDMFAAGTDTTSTALEWTMTELLKHPEIMRKAQLEIRKITGNKPFVTESDIEKMVYLKSVIKESFRLHPPLPLLVPRESSEDVKILGYDIPAKTGVIINAWTIGRDPKKWEEPEEFRPERFLGSAIDFKGHDFDLIPFGAGRRGCPGITFAAAMIETSLACLLHKFDWTLPGGAIPQNLDVTETSGLAVQKKSPLVAVATPRYS